MTIIPEDFQIHKPDKKLLEKMDSIEIDEKILCEIESDFHNITVVESEIGRFLKYLDTYQAGFINTPFYKGNLPYINYFLIPYLMNKNIKNILLVGFGSGILVNQFEKLFDLNIIDVVDIEENIFELAEKYFDFKRTENVNFYLQDALVYLKTTKKKYDLIVVDVAGDEGIDERFCSNDYLKSVNARLKRGGIFVSNLPSSRDVFNKKNEFILNLIEEYKKEFLDVKIFNGETSNKIFYKTFFDLDEIVLDITNLILISSNKDYELNLTDKTFEFVKEKIDVNLKEFTLDLV